MRFEKIGGGGGVVAGRHWKQRLELTLFIIFDEFWAVSKPARNFEYFVLPTRPTNISTQPTLATSFQVLEVHVYTTTTNHTPTPPPSNASLTADKTSGINGFNGIQCWRFWWTRGRTVLDLWKGASYSPSKGYKLHKNRGFVDWWALNGAISFANCFEKEESAHELGSMISVSYLDVYLGKDTVTLTVPEAK